MKIKAYNIKWQGQEDAELPSEVIIDEKDIDFDYDRVADYLSDKYGFLVELLEIIDITPFNNDIEKMRDFRELSKKDFLKSYSYLTEEAYNETRIIDRDRVEILANEIIEKVEEEIEELGGKKEFFDDVAYWRILDFIKNIFYNELKN